MFGINLQPKPLLEEGKIFKPDYMIRVSNKDAYCRNCGVEVKKDKLYLKEMKGEKEDVDLFCINCRLCKNRHNLNYRYDLKSIGSGSYLKNIYVCDICKTETSADKGVLSCPSCKYDMCPKCEQRCFKFDIPENLA